ncbi:HEAT repeat domain-containing protein [candidate division TA06 bacterium]|uniref:HEAT repeat domain-containing protein n=1 Tax=candidate division TA06 bacterium TaxID=2250710 RepID=A0A523UXM5_UNCT6|nr:MAG: HEAT repeat domain-containing protein [candidate division TA06 bacterium]
MRRNVIVAVALVGFLVPSYVLCSNGVFEKYRYHLDLFQEADVDTVIGLLGHADRGVRREALTLIGVAFRKGFSSAERAIPRLVEIMTTDSDLWLRVLAAGELAGVGDERALEPLLEIASDSMVDDIIRSTALHTLGTQGAKIGADKERVADIGRSLLDSPDLDARVQAFLALRLSEDRTKLKVFLQSFVDHYVHPDSSLMSQPALSPGQNRSAYNDFSSIFRDGLHSVALKTPDLLYELLEHPNEMVRSEVTWSLAQRGDRRVVDILIDLLKNSENGYVRALAAAGLEYVPDKKALPVLVEALKDNWSPYDGAGTVADVVYNTLVSAYDVEVESIGEPPGPYRYKIIKKEE